MRKSKCRRTLRWVLFAQCQHSLVVHRFRYFIYLNAVSSPHGNGCGTRKKKEEGRGERKKFDGDDKRCSCKRAQSKERQVAHVFWFLYSLQWCVLALFKSLNSVLLSNIRYQHSEASHIGSGCPLHSLKAWEKRLDVLRLKKGVGCSEKYASS